MVGALVAADQVVQYTLLRDGMYGARAIAPFDPPLFSAKQRLILAELEGRYGADPAGFAARAEWDAELGWCPRPTSARGVFRYDERGARLAPAAATDPGARLIATVGCSFTRGDEVGAAQTWPALLDARHPELVCANFGVGGYGLDQVLLRFRRDVATLSPHEVWLGFLPSSLLRATTHFPPLFNHWGKQLVFKPRFLLDGDGALVLAENPTREVGDTFRLLHDQAAFLRAAGKSDFWVQRTPAAFAPRGSSVLHRFASTRVALTLFEARAHSSLEWLGRTDSEPYRLGLALIRTLAREARALGARFRMLILPSERELYLEREHWPWDALVSELEAGGIEVFDTSAVLRGQSGLWMPSGHYSPRANQLLAEAIGERFLP